MSQFLRCPSCNEVIPFGERFCKYCAAELSYETAQQSAAQFSQISDACALANNIKTLTPYALILIAAYGFLAWSNWIRPSRSIWLFGIPVAPLLTVLYWFLKYRTIQATGEDFQKAQKDAQQALFIWIPTTVLLIVFLVFIYR